MPSERSPLAELLAELGQVFGDLGVRWYLFGAQADILYGAARLTADVGMSPPSSAAGIATKILAGRPKDIEDAASVVRTHGERLDVELIRTTLSLLERALDRSDLLPELERVLGQARRGMR